MEGTIQYPTRFIAIFGYAATVLPSKKLVVTPHPYLGIKERVHMDLYQGILILKKPRIVKD